MQPYLDPVLVRFREQLPRRPYCTDDLSAGLVIRSRDQAARYRYIQPNPPGLACWLVFDVDRPYAVLSWEDANLPPPNLTVMNLENGHAHLLYALAVPVRTSPSGRSHPLRYAAAIEAAYVAQLAADPHYSQLITKNPLRGDCWRVHCLHPTPYSLPYLADWVDLRPLSQKDATQGAQGLGRNCALFDQLRYWAYRQIMGYRIGSYAVWEVDVLAKAGELNCFQMPLPFSEIKATAKSVSKYCWRNFTPEGLQDLIARTHAPEAQSRRGRIGGIAGGKARAEKAAWRQAMAWELREQGKSLQEIAGILEVGRSTVKSYLYR